MSLRDEVDALNREFEKAAANHDVDAVMDLYTPDAWLLPAGAPMLQNGKDIRAFFQGMIDAGFQALELNSLVVEGGEELGVDVGRYRLTIDPPGADRIIDEGKYIVVLKRQNDGSLRIAYDTFNSDEAPPA